MAKESKNKGAAAAPARELRVTAERSFRFGKGREIARGEHRMTAAELDRIVGDSGAAAAREWLACGWLQVAPWSDEPASPAPPAAAPPAPPPEPGAFSPLPADDAAALAAIRASTSQAELNAWFNLSAAARPNLTDALMQRLKELDGA